MTVLITGFMPFGGQTVNPSWEAVSALADTIGGHRLEKLLLPVEYGKAASLTLEMARELSPEVILCVGQAGGRDAVTPEVIGINLREASIPDNAGVSPAGVPIDPSGPDAIMTDLPVGRMVKAVREAGLPARLSLSAGAYVCNDLYYAVMRGEERLGYCGLFIHVPAESELPLDDITRALRCCLQTLQA